MSSIFNFLAHDDTYGPGTDLAMALLGIFILSTAISKKNESVNNNRLKTISENQARVINSLAEKYNTAASYVKSSDDSSYLVSTHAVGNDKITIRNFETSQLFTFGEDLLFNVGRAELKEQGKETIGNLGTIIKMHMLYIKEIQIQGHADTTFPNVSSIIYKSNSELASARATTVFKFLNEYSGLDPSSMLMSIVSYGEYKPVQRKDNTVNWNRRMLNDANNTEGERSKNRRIEIVLIYR